MCCFIGKDKLIVCDPKPCWDLHKYWTVKGGLSEGLGKVNLSGVVTMEEAECEDYSDHQVNNGCISLPIVDSMLLFTAMHIQVSLPFTNRPVRPRWLVMVCYLVEWMTVVLLQAYQQFHLLPSSWPQQNAFCLQP